MELQPAKPRTENNKRASLITLADDDSDSAAGGLT